MATTKGLFLNPPRFRCIYYPLRWTADFSDNVVALSTSALVRKESDADSSAFCNRGFMHRMYFLFWFSISRPFGSADYVAKNWWKVRYMSSSCTWTLALRKSNPDIPECPNLSKRDRGAVIILCNCNPQIMTLQSWRSWDVYIIPRNGLYAGTLIWAQPRISTLDDKYNSLSATVYNILMRF